MLSFTALSWCQRSSYLRCWGGSEQSVGALLRPRLVPRRGGGVGFLPWAARAACWILGCLSAASTAGWGGWLSRIQGAEGGGSLRQDWGLQAGVAGATLFVGAAVRSKVDVGSTVQAEGWLLPWYTAGASVVLGPGFGGASRSLLYYLDMGFFFPNQRAYAGGYSRLRQPEVGLATTVDAQGVSGSLSAEAQGLALGVEAAVDVYAPGRTETGGTVPADEGVGMGGEEAPELEELGGYLEGGLDEELGSGAVGVGLGLGGLVTPSIRRRAALGAASSSKLTAAAAVGVDEVAVLRARLAQQIYVARQGRLDFDFRTLMGQFKQPQVRYRPGMATQWRVYRRRFARQFNAPWGRRQKQLTAYVARLWRIACFSYFRLIYLSVGVLLFASQLLPQQGVSIQTYTGVCRGWFTLNGQRCQNPMAQVYQGDILGWRGPLGGLYRARGVGGTRPTWRGSEFWTQRWLGQLDTPVCLEVDELTLTAVLLFEPLEWTFLLGRGGPQLPFLTLKCYNWKYIT